MKKMRRLIPAIAMLLVSAVMLSTASFAWFTMSENATAGGMQVTAKASGTLIIGTAPLQDDDTKTQVEIGTAAHNLKPVTLKAGASDAWQWQEPVDGKLVDTATGLVGSTGLKEITPVANDNYFEEVIYLGSAGDVMTKRTLTITLSAPVASTGEAVKAYSAAIYVKEATSWTNTAADVNTSLTAKPDKILHIATYDGNNTVTLDNNGAGYTIPSVVGIQNDTYVGLQVVIRVFVDGDLKSDTKKPVTTYDYVAVGENQKYDATKTYFVKTGDTWGLANTQGYTAESTIPATWATSVATTTKSEYNYINSKNVPVTGSTLQLDFKVAKIPTDDGN